MNKIFPNGNKCGISFRIRQVVQLYHEDYVGAAVMCTLTCRDAFSIGNIQSNNARSRRNQ